MFKFDLIIIFFIVLLMSLTVAFALWIIDSPVLVSYFNGKPHETVCNSLREAQEYLVPTLTVVYLCKFPLLPI